MQREAANEMSFWEIHADDASSQNLCWALCRERVESANMDQWGLELLMFFKRAQSSTALDYAAGEKVGDSVVHKRDGGGERANSEQEG